MSEATSKLRIRQVRSRIGGTSTQRETLRSLGLRRIGHEVVKDDRPEIRGMVRTVAHLVSVEALSAAEAANVSVEALSAAETANVTVEEVDQR